MLSTKLFRILGIFLTLNLFTINMAMAESLDRAAIEKQAPLALEGYDVITYFELGGAKQGIETFQAIYQGKRYLFSSEENQQKFAKDPEQYLPQFDGLCAHSLVMEKDVQANPAIYTLQEGKLYMFVSEQARIEWSKNIVKNEIAANHNWTFKSEKRNEQISAKKRWKTDNSVKLFTF